MSPSLQLSCDSTYGIDDGNMLYGVQLPFLIGKFCFFNKINKEEQFLKTFLYLRCF